LSAVPAERLREDIEGISEDWQITHRTVPEAGLAMLTLRDGCLHDPFHLGEFPLASAWLKIRLPDGREAEGAARVMSDDPTLAETLALCDAVLAARLPGWERIDGELDQGMGLRRREARIRGTIRVKTKVEFSLLDEAERDYRA